jgi:hypothetical protein
LPTEIKQRLFSVREAGIILGRSVPSIWRDMAAGRLQYVHIGSAVKIKAKSIDRLCADGAPGKLNTPPRKTKSATVDAAR